MFKRGKSINRCLVPGLLAGALFVSTSVSADPVVLPPPPGAISPPPVFCFGVTGGDVLPGGGARIQFQVLNWTGESASQIRVRQDGFIRGNTGGLFAPGSGGGVLPFPGLGPGTSTPAQPSPDPINGWSVSYDSNPYGGEAAGVVADYYANPGNELQGIDLDPNNDLDFVDAPSLPSPLDSGVNALDGFFLDFPDLDIGERVLLQWELFDSTGDYVDSIPGNRNPFSFGTFQIDRGSNGSLRIAAFYSIGTYLSDINRAPPVDLALTDQNAVTLPATALASVPVPASAWLMLSGLIGLSGFAKRRRC